METYHTQKWSIIRDEKGHLSKGKIHLLQRKEMLLKVPGEPIIFGYRNLSQGKRDTL